MVKLSHGILLGNEEREKSGEKIFKYRFISYTFVLTIFKKKTGTKLIYPEKQ